MTPLNKSVRRVCVNARDGGRPIVASLELGDLIGVRLHGTRRTLYVPIMAIYHGAIKAERALKVKSKRKGKK